MESYSANFCARVYKTDNLWKGISMECQLCKQNQRASCCLLFHF
uniref:Uncharacterized protein n=1 Tax=Anguilla anguilla TaxID=7936 RepID=A0A0E9PYI4_ANGAN